MSCKWRGCTHACDGHAGQSHAAIGGRPYQPPHSACRVRGGLAAVANCARMPLCRFLHGNQLTGSLPAEWGAANAFTVLEHLTLGDNPLAATLPATWGTQGGWRMLSILNISDAPIYGPLPEAWGQGFPSLRKL